MDSIHKNITVDGFRFIGGLHTIARQPFICSVILRTLGTKQLPKEILGELMVRWSAKEELRNEFYKESKGKLTESGKRTTAFGYYLDLCSSLKLINSINNYYGCSKLSFVLLYFIGDENNFKIGLGEKLFYFLQMLMCDADGILYILGQLKHGVKSQKELQDSFLIEFNSRLMAKQENASTKVKDLVSEKYRVINYIWKRPNKYSEHLLVPRCEWLNSLEIVEIKRVGNYTNYSLSEKGFLLLNQLPLVNTTDICDVTEEWMNKNLFTVLHGIYGNERTRKFGALSSKERVEELGASIDRAFNVVKTSSSFKIPLLDTFYFIGIDLFCNRNISINFSEITSELEGGVSSQLRTYTLKLEGRINESYIISSH